MKVESIPDTDSLFRWVPANRINAKGRPSPGAFKELRGGMSTDWSKYSTPEESRARSPLPSTTGIARLAVGAVRGLNLTVTHAPRSWDEAHTNVTGIGEDAEVRLKLADLARMEGALPPR